MGDPFDISLQPYNVLPSMTSVSACGWAPCTIACAARVDPSGTVL